MENSMVAIVEGLLFGAGEPVLLTKLVEITEKTEQEVRAALEFLQNKYEHDKSSGLVLRQVENKFFLATKPEISSWVKELFSPQTYPPMSQAMYETLSVIAYNQPVTRGQIEVVRGVSSDSIVSRLLERGWIQEVGTLEAPGRPSLFSASEQFLIQFGIGSVMELPSMELMQYQTIRDLEQTLENTQPKQQKTEEGIKSD